MPLKFTAGVSKKLGLVGHGSIEATCRIEVMFDDKSSNNPADLQRRVEQLYAACRQAVEDELGRNLTDGAQLAADRPGTTSSGADTQSDRCDGLGASQKRIDYGE